MSFRLEQRDLEGRWDLNGKELDLIINSFNHRLAHSDWSNCFAEKIQNYVNDMGKAWFNRVNRSVISQSTDWKPKWVSSRLQAVADLHPSHTVNIDLGTDHAYLPILLVQNRHIPIAFGVDIAQSPLLNAAKIIEKTGMLGQISLVKGDGILPFLDHSLDDQTHLALSSKNYDRWLEMKAAGLVTVTICGVGGYLATELISQLPHWVSTVIIQANDHLDAVDLVLNDSKQGWSLTQLSITVERNRLFVTKLAQREQKLLKYDTKNDPLWRWVTLSRAVRKLSLTPANHESFLRKQDKFDEAVKEFFCIS